METGHESEIPFVVNLLLREAPACLFPSDNQPAGPLHLEFPASRMMRKHSTIPYKLVCPEYVVMAAQTK